MFVPGEQAVSYMIAGRAVTVEPTDVGWRAVCSDGEFAVHHHPTLFPDEPFLVEVWTRSGGGRFSHYTGKGFTASPSLEEFIECVRELLEALERDSQRSRAEGPRKATVKRMTLAKAAEAIQRKGEEDRDRDVEGGGEDG